MSAVPNATWLTIAEFDALPELEDREFELHEGEVVEVTFPIYVHGRLQDRLAALLKPLLATRGIIMVEVPFQILKAPRQTKRRADVAFVTHERDQRAMKERIVEGVPDLIIEVVSPSNSVPKMNRDARVFLENGAQEFWIVDYYNKSIRVRRKDRNDREYELGEMIELTVGPGSVAVSDVFDGIA